MLTTLHIRDLVVVAELELEFHPGMTVLTGETGAGKSILLTAIGLALGERADSGVIRPGAGRSEICLEFDLTDAAEARAWLEDNALTEESDACLIRRVISDDGRSRAFINNRPVTVQALQDLASCLMEIHGQHAHVRLLQSAEQRRLLDASAGLGDLIDQADRLAGRWLVAGRELDALTLPGVEQDERLEILRHQIHELDTQQVETLDLPALNEEHARLANSGRILSEGQAQLDLLSGEEVGAVASSLRLAVSGLADLARLDPALQAIATQLSEAAILIKDASHDLRRHLEHSEPDPGRMEILEQRITQLHDLARKHRVRPEDLASRLVELRDALAQTESATARVMELRAERDSLARDWLEVARTLSARRASAAQVMGEKISMAIRELGMPQGALLIEVQAREDATPRAGGIDQITFLISANPGMPPRPLAKVASGGELSRISLGIQVATLDQKSVPTLIFDEVDSGIGGGVAETVGRKLRALGQNRQVMCVTHLHQVAAQGHHHLCVAKATYNGLSSSTVSTLEHAGRIDEIARMLGGAHITEQALAHARELLANAE